MMEINHNATLEFGDLMTSTSCSNDITTTVDNQDNVDDVDMVANLKTSFSEEDHSKENEPIINGLLADINGENLDVATVDLGVTDLDLEGAQITPELEDKLLADDDTEVVPSTILNKTKLDEVKDTAASIKQNIQADNSETLRNPGDDLETLLSKINDIVDDCIEPEKNNSTEADLIKFNTPIKTKTLDEKCSNELDESVILLDDSVVEEPDNDEGKVKGEICENSLDKIVTATNKISSSNQENTAGLKALTVNHENLEESKSLTANDESSAKNQENVEQINELKTKQDLECSIPENIDITPSDQLILDVDLEDIQEKSTSPAKEKQDCVSEVETKVVEEKSSVENVATEDENTGLDNGDAKSEQEDTPKSDEDSTTLNKDEVTNKPDLVTAEPLTDKTSESTPVISLDADDSDDDIVFFCENSKSSMDTKEIKELESEKNNQVNEKKIDDEKKAEEKVAKVDESANNIDDDDDDDVVLLDDDEDDNLTKTRQQSNNSQSDVSLKSNNSQTDVSLKSDAKMDETIEKTEKSKIESTTDVQEEAAATKQLISNEDATKETDSKMVLDDNSDNAKDKFDAVANDGKLNTHSTAGADAEETNSNCSSSSNLLQEAKAVSEEGEEETDLVNDDEEDVAENESETAGTEVDIVEGEIGEDDSKEGAPPAKRIRLSTDDDDNKNETAEKCEISEDQKENLEKDKIENEMESDVIGGETEQKVNETNTKSDKDKIDLKRPLDSIESDEKTDLTCFTKKLKTDELPVEVTLEKEPPLEDDKFDVIEIPDGKEDDDDEVKSTKATEETATKSDAAEEIKEILPIVKAVPSHVPIPLYPPPQFEESPAEVNLDFLKRFKKSLDQMTKIDLEELILQKIVEAVIHKSEFGEMRELIEKQEKIIATHRTKITELSKQFRDLEMVHNRVLKDIEVKNSQFLMPVKITRAVGLQVFIPHKKNIEPALITIPTANAISSTTANVQQSPQNQYRTLNNSGSQLTSPSRQNSNDNTSAINSRLTTSVLPTATAAAVASTRRGCLQKITPQRPVDTSANTSQQTSAIYRAQQSQQALQQQNPTKLLNKSVSSAPAQIRNRFSGPASMAQPQQQLARQQPSPTNQLKNQLPNDQKKTNAERVREYRERQKEKKHFIESRKISPAPAKPHSSNAIAQQYRRPESTPQSTNSPATVPENYMSSIHQLPPGMPAVSITPAKPKEKSVIDLTDEDDVPALAPTTATTSTAVRRAPSSGPNNSNTSSGSSNYVLNKLQTNQTRLPPNQNTKAQTTARQQLASIMYGGSKTNGNPPVPTNIAGVTTPPGTSITRIQLPTRKSYSHPAPLPPTPTQNLNPAWKLPPPRPTIRISNLDNGIVISWTVEESMDRHADCVSYQIYAYQETSGPPLIDSWRHVGDVKAMLLPMAVTLTQFQEGQRYYFAVRAVDVHHRVGPFSLPKTWS